MVPLLKAAVLGTNPCRCVEVRNHVMKQPRFDKRWWKKKHLQGWEEGNMSAALHEVANLVIHFSFPRGMATQVVQHLRGRLATLSP